MASKAIMWLMIVLLLHLNCKGSLAFDSNLSREEELELEMQLKLLNRPFITTFQTEEGDIIDCVDINKQPALDHPSLKSHKIQTRPSTYPFGLSKDSSSSRDKSFINNNNRACPAGYVPIRRTIKKDLIRIRSLSSKEPTGIKTSIKGGVDFPYNQDVVSVAMKKGIKYYGASGSVSVYNLSVAQDQSSSSNIWIIGGPPQAPNVILAGWQVNPMINGDSLTRMFVYWTDRPTGNWWLAVGESHKTIGYWPKELFGHLNDGTEQVAWGGIAKPSPNGMSPPLGNGHKPNYSKYDDACYFRYMNYVDENNKGQFPANENTANYLSNNSCYALDNRETCGGEFFYYCITFGGPGGNNCSP
ncbi:uncharacterized protein LOC111014777 [Momordica charantia]|uniref:Uncharacterized protein LOC111014777 n=1 Tax=Momordica charantia TaxID=3673 RepID=A0A6J1CVJ6_MOMCH|nr:uncharacterized protein LOC111014777 [Momordica charantia]